MRQDILNTFLTNKNDSRKMRITILWARLAGYSVAFFRELVNTSNVEIQLIYQPVSKDAPYNSFDLSFCEMAVEDSRDTKNQLEALVTRFAPHCVLMSSWGLSCYMRLAQKLKKRGVYIVSTIDHQWEGRLKQYLGVAISPWYLKPCIDSFLVAGDRQAEFARRLGFNDLLYGLYAADISCFSDNIPITNRPKCFLFVGRLVSAKGIDLLVQGYRRYRDLCDEPWDLNIAGTGELEQVIKGVTGIKHMGFVQPDRLPNVMQQARCFILPSTWEPWGVVIHEAAFSNLPIIATDACGAITMFVRDGINGYIIPRKVESMASAMLRISNSSDEVLSDMSTSSHILANLWTPKKLAKYFYSSVTEKLKKGT